MSGARRTAPIALAATLVLGVLAEAGPPLAPDQADLALERRRAGRYAPPARATGAYEVAVTFHVVRLSDGTGGLPESTLDLALAQVNDAFAGTGLAFCRRGGTRFIDSDALYLEIDTLEGVDALRQTDPVPDTVNVYFTENLAIESGPLCGISSFTFDPVQGIVMDNDCVATPDDATSLAHEIGHYFDLFDTNETAFGLECATGVNCAEAGDLVCDTAAAPDPTEPEQNCIYTGLLAGPCPGDGLYQPDLANVMAEVDPACRVGLTPGQGARALATLLNLRPELTAGCPATAQRYYASAAAEPGGDGLSWATAFADLQDAFDAAGPEGPVEVWVAAGTYRPDRGTGNRDLAFALRSGLELYGGFAGGERALEDRDVAANETVLSGDLAQDDGSSDDLNPPWAFDNSFHVLTALGPGGGARLDGFTIRGGAALGAPAPRDRGGGLYVAGGTLTIEACRFEGHRAVSGGAVATEAAAILAVRLCGFSGNIAFDRGGAVYQPGISSSTYERCLVVRNRAFSGSGGGVSGPGTFRDCLFLGNVADGNGGGLSTGGPAVVRTSTIAFNVAGNSGGGLAGGGGDALEVSGCVLWGNENASGATESAQIWPLAGVEFSCVQGLSTLSGPGNTGEHPLFVNELGPDGEPGSGDEDLRLLEGSPCVNGGRPDGAYGPHDLDGLERVQQCRVDMGAWETPFFALDCNRNGEADACELLEEDADCDGNGALDQCDVADGTAEDCDGNGTPDACDLAAGVAADCNFDGVPDSCQIEGADCNGNGALDECDLSGTFRVVSPVLSPIGGGVPQSLAVEDAPTAFGDVTIELEILADSGQFAVELNRVGLDVVSGSLCQGFLETLTVPLETFEALVPGDQFTVAVVPSAIVDPFACDPSSVVIAVEYPRAPASDDVDGDGVPDECACPGDVARPLDGVRGVDDLVAIVLGWGTDDPVLDLDGSGAVDVGDLVLVILLWGPCP